MYILCAEFNSEELPELDFKKKVSDMFSIKAVLEKISSLLQENVLLNKSEGFKHKSVKFTINCVQFETPGSKMKAMLPFYR
jgi:hypothetical protein